MEVILEDVAAQIGIGPKPIHCHFDSEEQIFDAVWARRAPKLAGRRLKAMRRYDERVGGVVTVEKVLRAWLDPDLLLVAQGRSG